MFIKSCNLFTDYKYAIYNIQDGWMTNGKSSLPIMWGHNKATTFTHID